MVWNDIPKTNYVGNACPEGWRLPTKEECNGLLENHSSRTTLNGKNGIYARGNNSSLPNSSSVFLLYGGYRGQKQGNVLGRTGTLCGCYWTADIDGTLAVGMGITEEGEAYTVSYKRGAGRSIRCVKK